MVHGACCDGEAHAGKGCLPAGFGGCLVGCRGPLLAPLLLPPLPAAPPPSTRCSQPDEEGRDRGLDGARLFARSAAQQHRRQRSPGGLCVGAQPPPACPSRPTACLQPFSKQASSHVYNPVTKKAKQLGGTCGIHMCHNAFCAGQTTGPNDEVFIFGGHAADVQWFRRYKCVSTTPGQLQRIGRERSGRSRISGCLGPSHDCSSSSSSYFPGSHKTGKLKADKMSSNRWYPGPVTLPDGKILVAGGVKVGGYAGYFADDQQYNNPTYEVGCSWGRAEKRRRQETGRHAPAARRGNTSPNPAAPPFALAGL